MTRVDLLIVGAGPAGMTAAITARQNGLSVIVLDDQPAPGGQIWRSVEMASARYNILGPTYSEGKDTADAFRQSGAEYRSGTQLWQLEDGFRAFVTEDHKVEVIEADAVILATGAQERPAPFPGWTLPGVLTVGAAQLVLKNAGQIPTKPVWIAGCGPLPLLYATQLLAAGGKIAGFLDTTPPGQWRSALRYFPRALRAWRDLLKGLIWTATLRSKTKVVSGVLDLEVRGTDRLETLIYKTNDGKTTQVDASVLLVHEGVVPGIHPAMSLGCEIIWNDAQESFAPVVSKLGETTLPGLFIAGDGAGIAGAKAAKLRGELAALSAANILGKLSTLSLENTSTKSLQKLKKELAARPFLDAMYRPRASIFEPADQTLVCRCEEVTAGRVRSVIAGGSQGPNQVKVATRAGMGPCQGRQCGYTLTRMLCAARNQPPSDVGFLNIRPPLKPLTLGELATLKDTSSD